MPSSRPETVGELIERLQQLPPDYGLSFQYGFTLHQVKDRGVASFEFNELIGSDGRLEPAFPEEP